MKQQRLILLFVTTLAFGATRDSFKITASGGTPLTTSYSVSDTQSKVLLNMVYKKQCCVYNGTASLIAFNVDNGEAAAAPSSDTNEIPVPAGLGACAGGPISTRLYLRSYSGSNITSGTVTGWCE